MRYHRSFAYPFLLLFLGMSTGPTGASGQEIVPLSGNAPQATFPGGPGLLDPESFAPLLTHSPFLRTLDLSESIILTGTVKIDDELYVVLLDQESGDSQLLTASANAKGWRLVELDGNPAELPKLTARISTGVGEVFSVRFDERQFQPDKGGLGVNGPGRSSKSGEKAPVPERDYREGITGDGFRGPTPPELVRKLSQLEENTRNRLIQEIREIRDKGVSSEERREIFVKMVDKALKEKR